MHYDAIMVGTGEVGKPLYELLKGVYNILPVDPIYYPDNLKLEIKCTYLHICIPGNINNFDSIVKRYAKLYEPKAIIIHSTVLPGTVGNLNNNMNNICVFSPVNGKHANNNMKKDLLRYTKFVGADNETVGINVCAHLKRIGITKVKLLSSSFVAEWMKILSTTHFGYMIAWAQEVERIADEYGLDFAELTAHIQEQEDIVPPHYPGIIKGHCVIPNIKLLKNIRPSKIIEWIEWSNEMKRSKEKCE